MYIIWNIVYIEYTWLYILFENLFTIFKSLEVKYIELYTCFDGHIITFLILFIFLY